MYFGRDREFGGRDLKVVFMPVFASMWDSLAPLYYEHMNNWDECVVLPMPYYTKSMGGDLKSWRYDIATLPMGAEVKKEHRYLSRLNAVSDICTEILKILDLVQPDVIYINNPYDGCNVVTSVPSSLYSKELKKHTKKLIYVPYFAMKGNSISFHFVNMPGVKNADEVIVDSEEQRQAYVKVFGQYSIPHPEKVKARPSTKIEYLRMVRETGIVLPESWSVKIAAKKKVIFFNTTINMLSQNVSAYLEHLKHELYQFYENRHNDELILWRPHPLFLDTIIAFGPSYAVDYQKMVADFILRDYGIFDDSGDLQTAILVSDEYYGDESSVVRLFEALDKPVTIRQAF